MNKIIIFCLLSLSVLHAADLANTLKSNQQIQQRIIEEQKQQFNKDKKRKGIENKQVEIKEIELKPLQQSEICHEIKSIIVEDVTIFSNKAIKKIIKPYENKCLGQNEIANIMALLTNKYIREGYITSRVYLLEQNIALGILKFRAKEGRIGNMKEDENSTFSIYTAFPTQDGDLLNLRDLEQGLNQVNRLYSNSVTMSMEPSSKVGESDIIFTNLQQKPWNINLSLDNYSTESTGKEQMGANLGYDNLLGINDYLSITYKRAVRKNFHDKDKNSDSTTFSYVVPFGYYLFSAGTSKSYYRNTLSLNYGGTLSLSGDTDTTYLQTERLMYRNQKDKLKLVLKQRNTKTETYIDTEFIEVSSRELSYTDLNLDWNRYLASGSFGINIGVSKGIPMFGSLEDESNLPSSFPKAEATKYTFMMNYNYFSSLYDKDLRFSSILQAQTTEDVLYGSEQMNIGGIYTVRGFETTSISGDKGAYIRNDLILTLSKNVYGGSMQVYVLLDGGYVKSNISELNSGSLVGTGIGFIYGSKHIDTDVVLTKSLYRPNFLERESEEIYFRVSYKL